MLAVQTAPADVQRGIFGGHPTIMRVRAGKNGVQEVVDICVLVSVDRHCLDRKALIRTGKVLTDESVALKPAGQSCFCLEHLVAGGHDRRIGPLNEAHSRAVTH